MAQDTKWSVHDNIWHFTVTDPQFHPKGFTVYKVTCKTFPIRSPETLTEILCWKRYNDFKTLYKSLLALHKALHRRDQFPEFAKPKLFGRFDDAVIEERRLSAVELLNFVATQPHLYKSLVFKQFLEEGRTQLDSSQREPVMTPRPSNLNILSSGPSGDKSLAQELVSSEPGVDAQQKPADEKPATPSESLRQEAKDQAVNLVSRNGAAGNDRTEPAMLEGTWNFPQLADNISLSSSTGDDIVDTDDESLLATSLPDTDLAYFDPIGHDAGISSTDDKNESVKTNSWLLEGLNICAVMGSEFLDDQVAGESETASTPYATNDFKEAAMNSEAAVISTPTTPSSVNKNFPSGQSSPAGSSRKGSSGSGTATPGKSIDLEEFDPIRRLSQSSGSYKVECGKGDLDLSSEWQRSSSFASDVSVGSHGSQSSPSKHLQDKIHTDGGHSPGPGSPSRSQSTGSDRSQESEKLSSNKSTPLRASTSLLKRLVSGSHSSHKPKATTEPAAPTVDPGGKEDYIYLAASQICMAQNSEANGEFEVAFAYYKSGVGILLQGVQGDTNQTRRDAVRRKTAQYLMKAEDLFNRHLVDENIDERRWGADSFLSPSLDLDPSFAFIRGSVRELRNFQVLGIIDKVILVRDKLTDETFVIKSVPKSTTDTARTQSILPTTCPHMVTLHKFYETDNSVFLLLQYASGGKLWTYIGDYLNSDKGIQAIGEMNVNSLRTDPGNIYSGTKFETANKSDKTHINDTDNISSSRILNEEEAGSIVVKQKEEEAIEGCVQSVENSGVMRFSELKENSELYTEDNSIKYSSQAKIFDTANKGECDSEDPDIVSDSYVTDVVMCAHRKHSLDRRFSSFSDDYPPINEGDSSVISPTTAPDEDHFQSLLHENRTNLEAFSINSLDSEDTQRSSLPYREKSHSASECFESVDSPKHVASRQISADEVFTQMRRETLSVISEERTRHASIGQVFSHSVSSKLASNFNSDDLIKNSRVLIKQVEKVLAETGEDGAKVDERSSVTQTVAQLSFLSSEKTAEEPSIYDLNRTSWSETSDDSSDKNADSSASSDKPFSSPDHNNLNSSPSESDAFVKTNEDYTRAFDSKGSVISEAVKSSDLKTRSEDGEKHQSSAITTNTSSLFRQVSIPHKLSISRMNSKDLTRSASFECDLKSPTRNRARVVSTLFERLDSTNVEQIRIPESSIKKWMAQLVTAVSRLHSLGIICRDLKPSNILLGDGGQLYLTYFCSLGHGDPELDWDAIESLYAAPEVASVGGYDKSCDWWSIGALLYELVVGRSLSECHPGGINSHTCLHVPGFVSDETRGLLEGLLRHNPNERLGSGMAGSEEIKAHPFFTGVDWHALEYS